MNNDENFFEKIEEINDFNNEQENNRTEDIVYYLHKISFWVSIIGLYFLTKLIFFIMKLIYCINIGKSLLDLINII